MSQTQDALVRLILKMHVSVDGYVCTTTGDVEWIFPDFDDELQKWEVERLWQAGCHLMGRALFEEMAAYWPNSTEPYALPMNEIPKVVFSKTLKTAAWGKTEIAAGDLAVEVASLKRKSGKDVVAHGGASFAQSLAKLNLVDEYRLLVHPIALGSGKPCFASRLGLHLVSMQKFPSGVVALTYARK